MSNIFLDASRTPPGPTNPSWTRYRISLASQWSPNPPNRTQLGPMAAIWISHVGCQACAKAPLPILWFLMWLQMGHDTKHFVHCVKGFPKTAQWIVLFRFPTTLRCAGFRFKCIPSSSPSFLQRARASSSHIRSCQIISYHFISFHIMLPHHIPSYPILSYPITSYHIIAYRIVPSYSP